MDVRMFIGRATIYNAVEKAKQKPKQKWNDPNSPNGTLWTENDTDSKRGQMTVMEMQHLLPAPKGSTMYETLMHFTNQFTTLIDNVLNFCEVVQDGERFPTLVVADGDMPGVIR